MISGITGGKKERKEGGRDGKERGAGREAPTLAQHAGGGAPACELPTPLRLPLPPTHPPTPPPATPPFNAQQASPSQATFTLALSTTSACATWCQTSSRWVGGCGVGGRVGGRAGKGEGLWGTTASPPLSRTLTRTHSYAHAPARRRRCAPRAPSTRSRASPSRGASLGGASDSGRWSATPSWRMGPRTYSTTGERSALVVLLLLLRGLCSRACLLACLLV